MELYDRPWISLKVMSEFDHEEYGPWQRQKDAREYQELLTLNNIVGAHVLIREYFDRIRRCRRRRRVCLPPPEQVRAHF